jgi:hypothetical protein
MWHTTPERALNSLNSDNTTGDDWGLGVANVVLNGANGFAGLPANSNLFLEFSNELWNFNFIYAYANRQSAVRWGVANTGTGDGVDWHALVSTSIARTVKAANPSRVKMVLGMFGTTGFLPGAFGANYELANGNSTLNQAGYFYTTDSVVVAGGWGTPISNHDAVAIAPYFHPLDSYYNTTTGTGTFTDDSAMYNGTNNTSNGGGNYTGAANTTQAITNFVTQCTTVNTGGAQSTDYWLTAGLTGVTQQFAAGMAAINKKVICYEGGQDWATDAGNTAGTHTLTAADAAFSKAVQQSSQWATAQLAYLNRSASLAGAAMPGVYTFIGYGTSRFSYAYPDTYAGGVEGAALSGNPTFAAMGTRNRALVS